MQTQDPRKERKIKPTKNNYKKANDSPNPPKRTSPTTSTFAHLPTMHTPHKPKPTKIPHQNTPTQNSSQTHNPQPHPLPLPLKHKFLPAQHELKPANHPPHSTPPHPHPNGREQDKGPNVGGGQRARDAGRVGHLTDQKIETLVELQVVAYLPKCPTRHTAERGGHGMGN